MLKRLLVIVSFPVILAGCTSMNKGPSGNVDSLNGLQQISAPPRNIGPHGKRYDEDDVTDIRYTALKETAMSLGARAALAWRSDQIDAILSQDETVLDKAYNFYGLMLPDNILPPVLLEARNTLNLASPNTIRLSSQIYRIKSQARFVTAPPTWRDYIWMDYPKPSRPDNSLLPENASEQDIWNHYAAVGWKNGINQANNIFASNLARLNQDYEGMVLYLRLYQENMVSKPYVAKTDLGITGNGNHMSIDDRVLRITALPQLNLNGNTWKPILVPDPLAKYKLDLLKQIAPKMGSHQKAAAQFVK